MLFIKITNRLQFFDNVTLWNKVKTTVLCYCHFHFKILWFNAETKRCQKKSEVKCVVSILQKARKEAFEHLCRKIEYKAIANELESVKRGHNEAFYLLALSNGEARVKVFYLRWGGNDQCHWRNFGSLHRLLFLQLEQLSILLAWS